MQPLDPHTLFSLFEKGDEEIYEEHGVQDTLKNPYVLMGMVLEGMHNYYIMDMMYMKRYPKKYKNVRSITKYRYFEKLYGYLLRINSKKFEDIYKIGESFEIATVFKGLDDLREYFQGIEHYEKCQTIKDYQDLLIEANFLLRKIRK